LKAYNLIENQQKDTGDETYIEKSVRQQTYPQQMGKVFLALKLIEVKRFTVEWVLPDGESQHSEE
jgi:hypothetical protein